MRVEINKSRSIDGVLYRGAMATKKPSVITMAVDHRFALDASNYFEERKAGNEPTRGRIGIHLVAIYEDGKEEVLPVSLKGEIDKPRGEENDE